MATPTKPIAVTAGGGGGLSRDQLRTSSWSTPFRGVRAPDYWPTDLEGRSRALGTILGSDSFLCGPSAAVVLGLPLPMWLNDEVVHVGTQDEGSHRRRPNVVHRRMQVLPEEIVLIDGIQVTSAARTFLDLAARLPVHHLVAVGDSVLRDHAVSPAELRVILNHRIRYPGKVRARQTIPLLSPLAESPQESRTRALLHLAGLPKPQPQLIVRSPGGTIVARVDLGYEDRRLAIEYDGDHHRSVERYRRDAARRTTLRELGWYVIEVTAPDLNRPYPVVAKVRTALHVTSP